MYNIQCRVSVAVAFCVSKQMRYQITSHALYLFKIDAQGA